MSREKEQEFFEKAKWLLESLGGQLVAVLEEFDDDEIQALTEMGAEYYSDNPGDARAHMISQIIDEEYGRRFNQGDRDDVPNVTWIDF